MRRCVVRCGIRKPGRLEGAGFVKSRGDCSSELYQVQQAHWAAHLLCWQRMRLRGQGKVLFAMRIGTLCMRMSHDCIPKRYLCM